MADVRKEIDESIESMASTLNNGQLAKIAKMVTDMQAEAVKKDDPNISIIQVGNDKIPDKELVERYKKSNKQLKRKIERMISKSVMQEAEIRELQSKAYLNTDEAAAAVNKKLREEHPDLTRE